MQQGNNHMEKKLRQLENQQLPDLSNMDKHWQAMQRILANESNSAEANGLTATGRKKFTLFNRYFKTLLIAAAFIGASAVIYFVFNSNNNKPIQSIAATKKNATDHINNTAVQLNNENPPNPGNSQTGAVTNLTARVNTITKPPRPFFPTPLNNPSTAGFKLPDPANNSLNAGNAVVSDKPPLETAEDMIANFYKRIQKPVQEFTINAEKGGNIVCREGTTMSIPPSAFIDKYGRISGGEVKFMVEEYYKYSDMIAANLSTTSDGKQLITGGMVKISAISNGDWLQLRHDKAIELKMPTKEYDPQMKLFTSGSEREKVAGGYGHVNYAKPILIQNRSIDWQQAGVQTAFPAFDGKTKFLNVADEPYAVVERRNKRIGKFWMPKESSKSAEEMKAILEKRYGSYYDAIRVKKSGRFLRLLGRGQYTKDAKVGDSVRMTLADALRKHYISTSDSAYYAEKTKGDSIKYMQRALALRMAGTEIFLKGKQGTQVSSMDILDYKAMEKSLNSGNLMDLPDLNVDSIQARYKDFIRIQSSYSFTIKQMGWINCDRFSDNSNNIDFVINLPEGLEAKNFVSQLVFTDIRSVMPGTAFENKIGFRQIPANANVYLVGLGEKDGKVVSFMQKMNVNKTEADITELKETTAEEFMKKLSDLDMN